MNGSFGESLGALKLSAPLEVTHRVTKGLLQSRSLASVRAWINILGRLLKTCSLIRFCPEHQTLRVLMRIYKGAVTS